MNITAVAIVAVSFWGICEIIKQIKMKTKQDDSVTKELQEKVTQLQDRVATLEKIVTDEKYDLKREIDSL